MAIKTITLELTVQEEAALSRLLSKMCADDMRAGRIHVDHGDEEFIGRINAALNAIR